MTHDRVVSIHRVDGGIDVRLELLRRDQVLRQFGQIHKAEGAILRHAHELSGKDLRSISSVPIRNGTRDQGVMVSTFNIAVRVGTHEACFWE